MQGFISSVSHLSKESTLIPRSELAVIMMVPITYEKIQNLFTDLVLKSSAWLDKNLYWT